MGKINAPLKTSPTHTGRLREYIMKAIEVFGDRYLIRETFDIVDYRGGICGFAIFDENEDFLFHYDGGDEKEVIAEIKWKIYRRFIEQDCECE